MTDPWEAILTSLEPQYQELKELAARGSSVKITLTKKNKHWIISIVDSMEFDEFVYSDFDSQIVQSINWATEQLETWPNVRRMSYDSWWFVKKQDAEKFQTMFILKWLK